MVRARALSAGEGYPKAPGKRQVRPGAPTYTVKRAGQGVQYAATILGQDRWTAEWKIPLASLGLDPKASELPKLLFNLSVRKAGSNLWLLWVGPHDRTWAVESAGVLQFAP